MKGLIIKDLYLTKKYCRYIFIYDICGLIGVVTGGISYTWLLLIGLVTAMIPLTLYAYDERERWGKYALGLPIKRSQIVSAKYIMGIISFIFIILLVLIVYILRVMVYKDSAVDLLLVLESTLSSGVMILSISLPLNIKFGTEKARIVRFFLIGFISAMAGIITDTIPKEIETMNILSLPIILCIIALIYGISWFISIKIFEKKEL